MGRRARQGNTHEEKASLNGELRESWDVQCRKGVCRDRGLLASTPEIRPGVELTRLSTVREEYFSRSSGVWCPCPQRLVRISYDATQHLIWAPVPLSGCCSFYDSHLCLVCGSSTHHTHACEVTCLPHSPQLGASAFHGGLCYRSVSGVCIPGTVAAQGSPSLCPDVPSFPHPTFTRPVSSTRRPATECWKESRAGPNL